MERAAETALARGGVSAPLRGFPLRSGEVRCRPLRFLSKDLGGVAKQKLDTGFRRLYRGEASRNTPGNRLGLSMVSAVARLHGMSLEIYDAPPGCRTEMISKAAPR